MLYQIKKNIYIEIFLPNVTIQRLTLKQKNKYKNEKQI